MAGGGTWNDEAWEAIGDGVEITFWLNRDTGARLGLMERHSCRDGRRSMGYLPFTGVTPALGNGAHWTVEQVDPLTLSPSIQCQACPRHGWIRDGRWVAA